MTLLDMFPRFSELPIEVQLYIWKLAFFNANHCIGGRAVQFAFNNLTYSKLEINFTLKQIWNGWEFTPGLYKKSLKQSETEKSFQGYFTQSPPLHKSPVNLLDPAEAFFRSCYNKAIELCVEPNFRAVTEVGIGLWGLLGACYDSRLVALDHWCEQEKEWLWHPESRVGLRLLRVVQALRSQLDERKKSSKYQAIEKVPEMELLMAETYLSAADPDETGYVEPAKSFYFFPRLPWEIQTRCWVLAFAMSNHCLGGACQQFLFNGQGYINLGGNLQTVTSSWEVLPGIYNRLLKPTSRLAFQGYFSRQNILEKGNDGIWHPPPGNHNKCVELCVEPNFRAIIETGITLASLLHTCYWSRVMALEQWRYFMVAEGWVEGPGSKLAPIGKGPLTVVGTLLERLKARDWSKAGMGNKGTESSDEAKETRQPKLLKRTFATDFMVARGAPRDTTDVQVFTIP